MPDVTVSTAATTLDVTVSDETPTVAVSLTDPLSIEVSVTSPSGAGDMQTSIYDPTTVSADAFDLANHTGSITDSSVLIDGGLL